MSGNELSQNMAVVLTEKLRTEMMTCEKMVADRKISLYRKVRDSF